MLLSLFQNNLLPSGEKFEEGNSVIIQDVSRHHSGIYVCTADNDVGTPARAEIDLKVLCKFFQLLYHQQKTFPTSILTHVYLFQIRLKLKSIRHGFPLVKVSKLKSHVTFMPSP